MSELAATPAIGQEHERSDHEGDCKRDEETIRDRSSKLHVDPEGWVRVDEIEQLRMKRDVAEGSPKEE